MICGARERLGFLGAEIFEESLEIISSGVLSKIKKECNTEKLEGNLLNAAVDLVCAEYLLSSKSDNVKQITEGDTSVSFGEGKIESLISLYQTRGEEVLASYRCIKW